MEISTEKKSKARSKNFLEAEDVLLKRLIEPFKAVLLLRKCDKVTNNAKSNAWNEIAKRFNNATTYEPRTSVSLKFRFKMMKHCERSGKRLSAQIPYRGKKSEEDLSDENETLINEKRADWIEYIDDIKSEEHIKEQENIIDEDLDEEPIEEEYEIHEENVILSDTPVKSSRSMALNDQLTLAKIKLMQTQTELANREIRFVDEKTKYIQMRMRGCKCQELLQIL